ncbi:outer membrane protein [Terrihabitans rhizophilus]|jgi:outer membrane immunogenic protein|nr:outer membrane protein [Terrihabitans sp. PJ23]
MLRTLLLASAASVLIAGAAVAADMPTYPVETAEVAPSDWAGFYAGVHIGFGFSDYDFISLEGGEGGSYGGLDLDDEDGIIGGGQVGYNMQFGRFLLGVEGDIAGTGIEANDLDDEDGFSIETRINFIATARGRLGFTFDNLLVYGTGGAAFVSFEADYPPFADDDIAFGWAAGGGVEWRFMENVSAKIEYLRIEADAEDLALEPDTDVDIKLDTIKVGLNYHF